MPSFEKKVNKWLVGLIIGGTLIGVGGASMTPKGKKLRRSVWEFFAVGWEEFNKKVLEKKKKKH